MFTAINPHPCIDQRKILQSGADCHQIRFGCKLKPRSLPYDQDQDRDL